MISLEKFRSLAKPLEGEFVPFTNVESIPEATGIYQIWTKEGGALKVGIASNLRKRLRQHRKSRQPKLVGDDPVLPAAWRSKSSILAKHLFFDRSLDTAYDLSIQQGRQRYLDEKCVITYYVTGSRDEARRLEKELERTGQFAYCGEVQVRPSNLVRNNADY